MHLPQTTLFAVATTLDFDSAYSAALGNSSRGVWQRYLAVLAAVVAIAVGLDYAVVGDPEDAVWGATVRGYWALFGFSWVVFAALALPALARLIRRSADYYPGDEQGDE